MRSTRTIQLPLLGLAGLLLSACTLLPPPADHVVLHIGPTGQYALNNQPVASESLGSSIQALAEHDPATMIEISASPLAPIATVKAAVSQAKLAHVRLAFAQEGLKL